MGLHIQPDNSASEKALGDQESEVPAPHVDAAKRENHDKVDEMSANFSAAAPSDLKPFAVDGSVAIGGSNTAADKVTFLTAYRYATKQDLFLLAASALCAITGGGLVPIMPVGLSKIISYPPQTDRANRSCSVSWHPSFSATIRALRVGQTFLDQPRGLPCILCISRLPNSWQSTVQRWDSYTWEKAFQEKSESSTSQLYYDRSLPFSTNMARGNLPHA